MRTSLTWCIATACSVVAFRAAMGQVSGVPTVTPASLDTLSRWVMHNMSSIDPALLRNPATAASIRVVDSLLRRLGLAPAGASHTESVGLSAGTPRLYWVHARGLIDSAAFESLCTTPDTVTTQDSIISRNARAYVARQINVICALLAEEAASRVLAGADSTWQVTDTALGRFVALPEAARSAINQHASKCDSLRQPPDLRVVSTNAARAIGLDLKRLCQAVVQLLAESPDTVVVVTGTDASGQLSTTRRLDESIESLRRATVALAFQLWRTSMAAPPGNSGTTIVVRCFCRIQCGNNHAPSFTSAGLALVDNQNAAGVGVAGRLRRVNVLIAIRLAVTGPGGAIDIGAGPSGGRLGTLHVFATVEYRTKSNHLGVGVFAMPFQFGRLTMGAGFATTGLLTTVVGLR